jgi:hypothetical protein
VLDYSAIPSGRSKEGTHSVQERSGLFLSDATRTTPNKNYSATSLLTAQLWNRTPQPTPNPVRVELRD